MWVGKWQVLDKGWHVSVNQELIGDLLHGKVTKVNSNSLHCLK
jgi:hypothetical protein